MDSTNQKPSVGRIVHLNDNNECVACLIVKVNEDGTVHLRAFYVNGVDTYYPSVEKGTKNQQWHWPEKV